MEELTFLISLYETYGVGILPLVLLAVILRWLQKNQDQYVQNMAGLVKSVRQNSRVLATMEQMLLTHDLTVRGLNPDAGGDLEERTNRAYLVYKQIDDKLSQLLNRLDDPED